MLKSPSAFAVSLNDIRSHPSACRVGSKTTIAFGTGAPDSFTACPFNVQSRPAAAMAEAKNSKWANNKFENLILIRHNKSQAVPRPSTSISYNHRTNKG
jgi:hypothetical protein